MNSRNTDPFSLCVTLMTCSPRSTVPMTWMLPSTTADATDAAVPEAPDGDRVEVSLLLLWWWAPLSKPLGERRREPLDLVPPPPPPTPLLLELLTYSSTISFDILDDVRFCSLVPCCFSLMI